MRKRDVYKRQAVLLIVLVDEIGFAHFDLPSSLAAVSYTHLFPDFDPSIRAVGALYIQGNGPFAGLRIAVNGAGLDVYKRQPDRRPFARRTSYAQSLLDHPRRPLRRSERNPPVSDDRNENPNALCRRRYAGTRQ